MSGTAPPTPAASAAPSLRGYPAAAPSTRVTADSSGGVVIPEDKVVVWDDTMKQMVVKNRDEVTLTVRFCCC